MLSDSLSHFNYIQRSQSSSEDIVEQHHFLSYPKSLNKKVILLQHFKSYLDGNQKFRPIECRPGEEPAKQGGADLPYLKKWKRAKKAVLFRLSNKIIQVLFSDSSELILCSGSGMVTFVTAQKQVKKLPLSSDLECKDPSMYKRLQYAKEILI